MTHQGGEPDPEDGNVNDCALHEVLRRDSRQSESRTCLNSCVGAAEAAMSTSGDCFSAYSGMNGCVAGLTCPQVDAFIFRTPPESYPCKAQFDAWASCM